MFCFYYDLLFSFRFRTENSIQDEEQEGNKKKKKRKNKKKNLDGDADGEEVINSQNDIEINESVDVIHGSIPDASIEKKKKKKKRQSETNLSSSSSDHSNSVSLSKSVNTDKKKKNKNFNDNKHISEDMSNISSKQDSEVTEKFDNHHSISIDNNMKKEKKKQKYVNNADAVPEVTNALLEGTISETNEQSKTDTSMRNGNKSNKRKHQDNLNSHQTGKKARKNLDQSDGSCKKFRKGNHNWRDGKRSQQELEISDARLKAYGIHPKKFKNKMKYGPQS